MDKNIIGITIGDINGIGPEVIIKTLQNKDIQNLFTPVIYGSSKVMEQHCKLLNTRLDFRKIESIHEVEDDEIYVMECWNDAVELKLGQVTPDSGKYALKALETAVKDYNNDEIDAIVTAPINKYAMGLSDFSFPGHTEYFTHKYKGKSLMLMVSDELKVAVATNHVEIEKVASLIKKELVEEKIQILHKTLVEDFGKEKPLIAVLGLNPHASDNGKIGLEEDIHIKPAIMECKNKGITAIGPFPADGFFGTQQHTKFDAILAMYHDQGLIPFKLLSFGSGVNFTAGLPLVRTSPDHGTGYDIVGKNQADERSMLHAIYRALDIINNRRNHKEMTKNPLVRTTEHQNNKKGRRS